MLFFKKTWNSGRRRKMQIKYISQPHQIKAINAITDLFQGQIKQISDYDIFDGEAVCANNLSIDKDTILENLKAIQTINKIKEKSSSLDTLDFSIEMETGTGKTKDIAVIKLDESEGSFIVETKGSDKDRDLRGVEAWKIAYAKKHFELLNIKYKDKITNCKDI